LFFVEVFVETYKNSEYKSVEKSLSFMYIYLLGLTRENYKIIIFILKDFMLFSYDNVTNK